MRQINTREYWNTVWAREGLETKRLYKELYKRVLEFIPKGKKILDVGCGVGVLLQRIKEEKNPKELAGMDISDVAANFVRQQGIKAAVASLPHIPAEDDEFDICVSTETIEHLTWDRESIKQMLRVAPEIIITVPNNVLSPEQEPEHQRTYTKKGLEEIMGLYCKEYKVEEVQHFLVGWGKRKSKPLFKKIFWHFLHQGTMRFENWFILRQIFDNCGHKIYEHWSAERPIENNRNKAVLEFLKTDAECMVMMDSDQIPPINILDLVDYEKDVMSGFTFTIQGNDVIPVQMKYIKSVGGLLPAKLYRSEGLSEIDAGGTGFMVVKREVLEKVKAPFERKWSKDGVAEFGLDYYFCQKAKKLGYTIWTHTHYPLTHAKEVDLKKIYFRELGDRMW